MKDVITKSTLKGILSTLFQILEKERTNYSRDGFITLADETKQKLVAKPERFINGVVASEHNKLLIECLFDEFIERYD